MAHFNVSVGGLCLGLLFALSGPAVWANTAELKDHELVSPYQGSVLRERADEAFNEYRRIVGAGSEGTKTDTVEGKISRLRYDNPKGRSTLEIERNYRQALEANGLVVDFQCAGRQACGHQREPSWNSLNGLNLGVGGDVRYFTGRLPVGSGHVWVSVAVNPQRTFLHIAEPAGMQTGLVKVDANALASALDAQGKVDLVGIFFDSGTATLRPESSPALDAAAGLMRERASLALDVVGHTDNQGGDAFNLDLSRQRAAAVVSALTARGVPAARLGSRGMGASQPVADNATEEGRARNRRVELIRR